MKADVRDHRDELPEVEPPESSGGPSEAEGEADTAGDAPAAEAPEALDYKDRWMRAEAELQNLRRRSRRDADEARRVAEEAVLLDLVGLLDDIERAVESAKAGGAPPPWVEGVALVLQRGREYLERQGVTVVDPVGQPFDPAFHHAMLEVEAPEDAVPGQVVQVIHKGFRRGSRPLRAASVVVARAKAAGL